MHHVLTWSSWILLLIVCPFNITSSLNPVYLCNNPVISTKWLFYMIWDVYSITFYCKNISAFIKDQSNEKPLKYVLECYSGPFNLKYLHKVKKLVLSSETRMGILYNSDDFFWPKLSHFFVNFWTGVKISHFSILSNFWATFYLHLLVTLFLRLEIICGKPGEPRLAPFSQHEPLLWWSWSSGWCVLRIVAHCVRPSGACKRSWSNRGASEKIQVCPLDNYLGKSNKILN